MMEILIPVLIGLFLVFGPWIFIFMLFKRLGVAESELRALKGLVRQNGTGVETPVTDAAPIQPEPEATAPTADLVAPDTSDDEIYRPETSAPDKVTGRAR